MKRIQQIDLARVIAMLSVILIHVTSTYINNVSRLMILNMNTAFILNQVTRFSVPLFIMLSGISLGLTDTAGGIKQFYKNKIFKIGIPYIFWFTIYFLYSHNFNLITVSPRSLIKSFLLGQATSHLYFVALIFQFYLLYPFLRNVVRKNPWRNILISFIISYTIQQLFFLRNFNVDLIPTFICPYLWMLFPTWLFYFVVGVALTKPHLFLIQKFSFQNASLILITTSIYSVFFVVESKTIGMLDSIKPSLNIYTLLVLLSSFALWKYVEKYKAIQKLTEYWAKHSMTVYFNHVLVLNFFRPFPFFNRGISGMFFLYITVVLVATLLADIIDKFWLSSTKKIKNQLGKANKTT